jgi:prepilin-type N-terminal cleavage/methylation domain-containing protein
MSRPQAGFTLLEVVVAMAVVGAGFAVGLAAMSGSLRLQRSSDEYEQAMLLARAAMTEALAYPDYDIADDREREIYQGVEYAYRVEFRPVRLTPSTQSTQSTQSSEADSARAAQATLQQIAVDVYWGEGRNYRLVTYRRAQAASAASPPRTRGNAPAAGGTAAAKDGATGSGERPLETRSQDERPRP